MFGQCFSFFPDENFLLFLMDPGRGFDSRRLHHLLLIISISWNIFSNKNYVTRPSPEFKNGPSSPRFTFIKLAFFLPKNHPENFLFSLPRIIRYREKN